MAHPREVLNRLGASPLKALSQNFLTSPHWAQTLVSQFLSSGEFEEVWEIGPGLGALTELLVQQCTKPIRLFEFDKKLAGYLKERFPELTIYQGDFLEVDWAKLTLPNRKIAILSNLPYHLSSPLLFRMAEKKELLSHFLFTFQKEFAERLMARPGTKDYGALTLLIELHFNLKNIGVIPHGAFYPAPNVASQAILFTPKALHPHEKKLITLIKAAFFHRRKKMAGNLKEAFPGVEWERALEQVGLDPNIRAEKLSLVEFEKLISFIE
jgi:16S rRNA (adenine1518-N6/adenine1519-N6)-dimethyltransferase